MKDLVVCGAFTKITQKHLWTWKTLKIISVLNIPFIVWSINGVFFLLIFVERLTAIPHLFIFYFSSKKQDLDTARHTLYIIMKQIFSVICFCSYILIVVGSKTTVRFYNIQFSLRLLMLFTVRNLRRLVIFLYGSFSKLGQLICNDTKTFLICVQFLSSIHFFFIYIL